MVCGGDVTVLLQAILGAGAVRVQRMNPIVEERSGWLVQRKNGGAPPLLEENGAELLNAGEL